MNNSEINMSKVALALLKLTISILLAVWALNFTKSVSNHPVIPEKSSELTTEQKKLKEFFLNDSDSPGVLTQNEKEIISDEVMSSTEIFGIKITGIKYPDLTFALSAWSLIAFFHYFVGFVSVFGIRKKEFNVFHFFIISLFVLFDSYLAYRTHGFELASIVLIMLITTILIGLANWPLWYLCDKFIDRNPEQKSA